MTKEKQTEKVLGYIERFGSINPMEALRDLSVMRLASRINDLKKLGYNIEKTMTKAENRFGDTVRFATYRMKVTE